MDKVQADEVSAQADSETADSEIVRVTFEAWAREAVRDAFLDLAADEVERLWSETDRISTLDIRKRRLQRFLALNNRPHLRRRTRAVARGESASVCRHRWALRTPAR